MMRWPPHEAVTRRRVLGLGLAGAISVAGGVELVERRVVPGRGLLDRLDGSCDVAAPRLTYDRPGPVLSGSFASAARGRVVGFAIAYPPGHGPGSRLPLIVALHGYGGDHNRVMAGGLTPAQALAERVDGIGLPPVAVAAVDGGNGYWHEHPGDDPMAMLVGEFIPRCQRAGLGRPPQRIGAMGISMGGYGSLLLAERHPGAISAVAAIGPAVWTSYGQAHAADAGAFASPEDFAANDVIAHAGGLAGVAVRVAGGVDDPFYPGVRALVRALPAGAGVELTAGCHTGPFFASQQPPSLAFLAARLDPTARVRSGPGQTLTPPDGRAAPGARTGGGEQQ